MKRLAPIILAIILVSVATGGYVYAQSTHKPITDQKLIGYGPYGYNTSISGEIYYSLFTITNPDCEYAITINQVSIYQADGTVVYEYPSDAAPWNTTLQPHQVRVIPLVSYLSPPSDVANQFYTVEISWSAHKKCLPLIGNQVVFQKNNFLDGTFTMSKTRVEMVSMK